MTDTEPLDLDAIEAWLSEKPTDEELRTGAPYAFHSLIAEVRRLREESQRGWEYGVPSRDEWVSDLLMTEAEAAAWNAVEGRANPAMKRQAAVASGAWQLLGDGIR